MSATFPAASLKKWSPEQAAELSPLEALAYRSNLLGSNRAIANYGGGNTSAKLREVDHVGRELEVLWVKGSGSDLATIGADGFTGLRLAEILPLADRDAMTDEEMVAYLARCQLAPAMPRASIETLLHAFIPAAHVDHTHPDTIGAIVGAVDGERMAEECFGSEAVWIPYIRPGFALSKLVARGGRRAARGQVRAAREARPRDVGRHARGVLRGDARSREPRGGIRRGARPRPAAAPAAAALDAARRDELLAAVLPALRGAVSVDGPRILQLDTSPAVLDFVCAEGAAELSQIGAACPDHLVHTKRRPLWVDFDPARDDAEALRERLVEGVRAFHERERAYFEAEPGPDDRVLDPSPRVVLVQGVGMVSVGRTLKAARLSRDLYHRAIAVMSGASALGGFVSLTDAESFAVEYWPLELYKLSLAPPPREFEGKVAFITGAAGGIGGSTARALAELGACVVATDIDLDRVQLVAESLGDNAVALRTDVTDERSVAESYRLAVARLRRDRRGRLERRDRRERADRGDDAGALGAQPRGARRAATS